MAHRSDLDPPSLRVAPGRKAHRRDEARVVLIPSGPAGTILHEQAEYRTATWFPSTPNHPLPHRVPFRWSLANGATATGTTATSVASSRASAAPALRYGPSDDTTPAAADGQVRPEARFRPRQGGGQWPLDLTLPGGKPCQDGAVHIGATPPTAAGTSDMVPDTVADTPPLAEPRQRSKRGGRSRPFPHRWRGSGRPVQDEKPEQRQRKMEAGGLTPPPLFS